jgi:diguanylate cyclase (GGDEF)-like protein
MIIALFSWYLIKRKTIIIITVFQKKVSETNAHDQWYFEFLESGKVYDLDVDIDEVTNEMTVFINCRIVDESDEELAVVGVGLSMNQVQKLLNTFEVAYDLEAFIMDEEGLVQVHTNDELIETYQVDQDPIIHTVMPKIKANKSSLETFRYRENDIDGYLITRYIEDLEWYLVVKKDTSVLQKSFDEQLAEEFMILAIVILGVVITSTRLIKRHEAKLVAAAKTDQLTGLLNRRGFDYIIFDCIKETSHKEQSLCVFIFDIDNFKSINDTYGHLFGDKVIEQVAMFVKKAIGSENVLARWGGDEFAGYIKGDYSEAKRVLKSLHDSFSTNKNFTSHHITISLGITLSRIIDTPDTIMARADKALYQAKQEGKNRICETL